MRGLTLWRGFPPARSNRLAVCRASNYRPLGRTRLFPRPPPPPGPQGAGVDEGGELGAEDEEWSEEWPSFTPSVSHAEAVPEKAALEGGRQAGQPHRRSPTPLSNADDRVAEKAQLHLKLSRLQYEMQGASNKRDMKRVVDKERRLRYGPNYRHMDVRYFLLRRERAPSLRRKRGGLATDDSFKRPVTFFKFRRIFRNQILRERCAALEETLPALNQDLGQYLYRHVPGLLCLVTSEVAENPELGLMDPNKLEARCSKIARQLGVPLRQVITSVAEDRDLLALGGPRLLTRCDELAVVLGVPRHQAFDLLVGCPALLQLPLPLLLKALNHMQQLVRLSSATSSVQDSACATESDSLYFDSPHPESDSLHRESDSLHSESGALYSPPHAWCTPEEALVGARQLSLLRPKLLVAAGLVSSEVSDSGAPDPQPLISCSQLLCQLLHLQPVEAIQLMVDAPEVVTLAGHELEAAVDSLAACFTELAAMSGGEGDRVAGGRGGQLKKGDSLAILSAAASILASPQLLLQPPANIQLALAELLQLSLKVEGGLEDQKTARGSISGEQGAARAVLAMPSYSQPTPSSSQPTPSSSPSSPSSPPSPSSSIHKLRHAWNLLKRAPSLLLVTDHVPARAKLRAVLERGVHAELAKALPTHSRAVHRSSNIFTDASLEALIRDHPELLVGAASAHLSPASIQLPGLASPISSEKASSGGVGTALRHGLRRFLSALQTSSGVMWRELQSSDLQTIMEAVCDGAQYTWACLIRDLCTNLGGSLAQVLALLATYPQLLVPDCRLEPESTLLYYKLSKRYRQISALNQSYGVFLSMNQETVPPDLYFRTAVQQADQLASAAKRLSRATGFRAVHSLAVLCAAAQASGSAKSAPPKPDSTSTAGVSPSYGAVEGPAANMLALDAAVLKGVTSLVALLRTQPSWRLELERSLSIMTPGNTQGLETVLIHGSSGADRLQSLVTAQRHHISFRAALNLSCEEVEQLCTASTMYGTDLLAGTSSGGPTTSTVLSAPSTSSTARGYMTRSSRPSAPTRRTAVQLPPTSVSPPGPNPAIQTQPQPSSTQHVRSSEAGGPRTRLPEGTETGQATQNASQSEAEPQAPN
eukprot:gene6331-2956_t